MYTEWSQRAEIRWQGPDFLDKVELESELRDTFDICSTCRRCVSLCESFPRLFDLIDNTSAKDIRSVDSVRFSEVVDACTLCDMCYPICPYILPHKYEIDFPNMVIRYRALQRNMGNRNYQQEQLAKIDRNGRIFCYWSRIINWITSKENLVARLVLQWIAGIDRRAVLPKFQPQRFSRQSSVREVRINREAPGFGRKVVIYATCFVEYNKSGIGIAASTVLEKNGVEVEIVYSECCGMPQLEGGSLEEVSRKAISISSELVRWIDRGYDIVTLIPSCSLMMKSTWSLYLPDDQDVKKVALNTYDISEYLVELFGQDGIAEGLRPIGGDITLHYACHAQAQNMGPKSAIILRLIPECNVTVTQRCSGHGGTWGVLKKNHQVAVEFGAPLVNRIVSDQRKYFASECPLAGEHLLDGVATCGKQLRSKVDRSFHPIELLAKSYGVDIV
jgi:glycerol-3-phosphate dehydrogenase subunit C